MEPSTVWEWMRANIDPLLHVVVTGDALGPDSFAHDYCKKYGVVVQVIPAGHLWGHYGKQAGFVRNPMVARAATRRIVAFWDGKSSGTEDTIEFGKELGKEIVYPLGPPPHQVDLMDLLK